jgi:hypothetical protein
MKISLTNFDEHRKNPPYLTSPRSLDACDRQGIRPEELLHRPSQSFFEKGIPDEVVKLRYEHYESRRKEKLAHVRTEYRSIVAESNASQRSMKDDGGNNLTQRSITSSMQAEEEKLNENMRRAMESMKRNMKDEVLSPLVLLGSESDFYCCLPCVPVSVRFSLTYKPTLRFAL